MNERVEQNITECDTEDGFDWETYQYMCDIADYWGCEE